MGKNINKEVFLDMENYPVISIVVPSYNVAPYIRKCIDSIINQTYPYWELLLVVGGNDGTIEICDEYEAQDKRIKSIHDNKGLVQARNVGYRHATGQWITYLDGDDWFDIDTCEVLSKYINEYKDLDIIYWRYIEELEDKTIDKWSDKSAVPFTLFNKNECKELAIKTLIYKYGLSDGVCKLVNMEYAKKYGIFHDERLVQGSEGVEFSLRAFYYASKALYVNRCFYHYRYVANSISKKVDESNTKFLADCYRVIREDIDGFVMKDKFIKAFYERTTYMLMAIAMNTYFSPMNSSSLPKKIAHYSKVISNEPLFKEAINKTSWENMDIFRKIVLVLLRLHLYIFLDPIARVKHFLLKKGFYNY